MLAQMTTGFLFQNLPHAGAAGEPHAAPRSARLLCAFPRTSCNSRLLGPVALVVDGCRDADDDGGEEVAGHVVVLFPGVFALEYFYKHEVQLDPLKTHPGEGSQEEEVQDPRDDGAADLRRRERQPIQTIKE